MYDTSDFRNGLKIEYQGDPFIIVEFQHVKPGKGNQFTRTKIKNLITGRVLDPTFKSGEKVGKPDIEEKTAAQTSARVCARECWRCYGIETNAPRSRS